MQGAASMRKRLSLCFVVLVMAGSWLSAGEQVPNPAYKHCARWKVGTWTKMEAELLPPANGESDGAGGTRDNLKMTFTFTLMEVAADKAVVRVAQIVHLNGRDAIMPGKQEEIPAMIDADKADIAMVNHDGKAAVTDVKRGQEDVQVLNKTLKCQWIEARVVRDSESSHIKVWYSDEIPGGTVKSETFTDTVPAKNRLTMAMKVVATEQGK